MDSTTIQYIVSIARGFGVETRLADANLSTLKWLYEGVTPKVLVVNISTTVPKLFL